eukprot:CAMPEP_0175317770 /NCGR_PEP_ID=MMETSP0093-20121207/70094_1 /TAXON_ID=311494 /ORGANISM="Alexandrium monilatum, Strain CCMP3105" /LENGTH=47 /DNA_ID= /DNA_START= /DNA_END= /DNA_ORIENTATION=
MEPFATGASTQSRQTGASQRPFSVKAVQLGARKRVRPPQVASPGSER